MTVFGTWSSPEPGITAAGEGAIAVLACKEAGEAAAHEVGLWAVQDGSGERLTEARFGSLGEIGGAALSRMDDSLTFIVSQRPG